MAITTTTMIVMGVMMAGSMMAAQAQQKQAKTEANILREQAERERQQAAADSQEFKDQQARVLAQRRAVMGGSGVDLSTGSPLLAAEDFAGEVELQALKIRNGGDVRSTRLEQQAGLTIMKGNAAAQQTMFSGLTRSASLLAG